MRFDRLLTTIDAHAEGMPIRLVIGGGVDIPGKTMIEKRDFVKQNLDYWRTSLVFEPRGHGGMFAAILTPPVTGEAAFGLIFMSPLGYSSMCGHGSMGVAVIAVETGIVDTKEPVTEIIIDTPAGAIRTRVNVENGKSKSVSLRNVPSFLYKAGLVIRIPGLGEVPVDIAYGGNYFAIVEAEYLGITTEVNAILNSGSLFEQVRDCINQQVVVKHPETGQVDRIMLLISDKPTNPEANVKNIAAGPHGFIDRSPCGTGTSARLATQYFKGELGLGETFVTESLIGTLFYGKVVKEVSVGGVRAVVPEVTGRAFITGMHHFVIDKDDPFKYGFRL
jgi:proline racemase